MDHRAASLALIALSQDHRRSVFKLLVERGPAGMTAGAIADMIGISRNALSFHLKELSRAGLVRFRREGRYKRYAAEFTGMRQLLRFLADDCCRGHPEICGDIGHAILEHSSRPDRRRTMSDRVFNVLFLCTGNSARSIMAECLLNRWGSRHFRAFSAGSKPMGEIHPYARDILRNENYDVSQLRSKSWEEFCGPDTPELDFVFTVCDDAANEVCPVWPGQPMSAHWGVPDPARAEGSEAEKRFAFADTMRMLTQRISIFVSLPIDNLDRLALQKHLDEIGIGDETPQRRSA